MQYTPSDCFETFPFPPSPLAPLPEGEGDKSGELIGDKTVGQRYFEHRQQIMLDRQEGLTKTYNRFHDPDETAADIQTLRDLHRDMDHAVAAAYGWHDLLPSTSGRGAGGEGLGHDFHTTKQGIRYTLSEAARREILDRLLELNHQRYAEEVKAGLHDKKKGKTGKKGTGRKKKKADVDQGELL